MPDFTELDSSEAQIAEIRASCIQVEKAIHRWTGSGPATRRTLPASPMIPFDEKAGVYLVSDAPAILGEELYSERVDDDNFLEGDTSISYGRYLHQYYDVIGIPDGFLQPDSYVVLCVPQLGVTQSGRTECDDYDVTTIYVDEQGVVYKMMSGAEYNERENHFEVIPKQNTYGTPVSRPMLRPKAMEYGKYELIRLDRAQSVDGYVPIWLGRNARHCTKEGKYIKEDGQVGYTTQGIAAFRDMVVKGSACYRLKIGSPALKKVPEKMTTIRSLVPNLVPAGNR